MECMSQSLRAENVEGGKDGVLAGNIYCSLYTYLARWNEHKVHEIAQSYTYMCICTIPATNIRPPTQTFSSLKQPQCDACTYKTNTKSPMRVYA